MLIGTDRTIFSPDSAVRRRLALFGSTYTEALNSIVFSARSHGIKKEQELAPKVHAYPTNSRSRLLYGWDALRIARHISRPDLVSTQDPFETGLAGLFISRRYGVPLAVEIHTDFLAPSFVQHSMLNRLRVRMAGHVLRHAKGGYTVSQKIRDAVFARYHLQLEVLPIYTDTTRFASLTHTKHPRFKTALLWVGRMEKEKNPELALDALVVARRAGFEVGITFVGNGRLKTSLEAKAHEQNVSEWVEFVGMIPDPLPYYASADLLLVTSEYEGYGMVIVEALAAKVPVLSTDVGIAREAGAIIADEDFTEALSNWLSAPSGPGILRMHSYENENAYFAEVAGFYNMLLS